MSNLPQDPKPQYEGKNEDTIIEKSVKVNESEYLAKLLNIIKENNKLEARNKDEQR